MTLAPALSCEKILDAALIERIANSPFWAAPLLRRKFRAEGRIAQGRLAGPEHFMPKGGAALQAAEPKRKRHDLRHVFFFWQPEKDSNYQIKFFMCK